MSDRKTRDVDADYRAAMIAEWTAYDGSGRTREADHVAKALREQYGYDVAPKPSKKADDGDQEKRQEGPPETTAKEAPSEAAVEPKPEPAGSRSPSRPRTTPAAKKAAPAKPSTEKSA
ncbi:hypothetical protein ACIQU5_31960 [Streptomyces sp. NPDC090306]|uniref:hypothetical protein n=1 Tax=Streptomyces sp. NPDC090306 TaxID=3365961 RepID=UPI003824F06A